MVSRRPSSAEIEAKAAEGDRDFARAARLYAEAGQLGHAVRCYLAADDKFTALRTLYRIPKDDPMYREAAVLAIALSLSLNRVEFDFDQFVARFLATSPSKEAELEAFYGAGLLFERNGFAESARDAFERLLAAAPDYRDAHDRFEALERASRPSAAVLERIVAEDDAFRRADRVRRPPTALPGTKDETFPSLPEIPVGHGIGRGASKKTPSAPPAKRNDGQETLSADSAPPGRASPVPEGSLATPGEGRHKLRPIPDIFAIPPGFVVGERYRVEKPLGRGGMAIVYRAHDRELDETIALKLFTHTTGDPALLSRFKQELALCRQITHPNVVRLYDIGSHNEVRFFTMELLSGVDLATQIDQGRDLVRDLGYLVQLCEGLQCVHEKGVVHRDLKPENVFVTHEDVVKLMDFGIAKRRKSEGNLTMDGFSAGTPAFMAPEQINNFASVTHLSDLYSLGVIAYRLFTGVLPFESESPMAVLVKHINEAPAPPSTHEPSIPDELEYVIMQLLEKDPRRRVQSCRELARDLAELRSRLMASRRSRPQPARRS